MKGANNKNGDYEDKQKVFSNIKQKNQFLEIVNQKSSNFQAPLIRQDSISEGSKYFN